MTNHESAMSATTDGLSVSPSLDLVVESAQVPVEQLPVTRRTATISGLCVLLGGVAAFVSQVLLAAINLVTNLAFYGQFSLAPRVPAPAVAALGWLVVLIPVAGAVVVGLMARYGSKAIRGHGIPEAMEQVLTNESRIPARITFLKPLSSAIAIGTGGPFGAEGPIIATGGALGSVLGQVLTTTVAERKILLAAGAAAGMAATFGSPLSAVLLAIELLLFEFRPRSIIPVAFAASAATGIRAWFEGAAPVFAMPNLQQPGGSALAIYIVLGAAVGIAAVAVTRIVYAIEDAFERLPLHWMWWPAIGAVAVGLAGYVAPDTLGVGYYNIRAILANDLAVPAVIFLCGMKFFSWSISLASGTSGGTLAPLFMIGGGLGSALGSAIAIAAPGLGVDPRLAALVGMAAIFSGASRAMLASAVFAFETTLQPFAVLPLLGGCAASYLVASLAMRNSIMTEKIARRGVRTPAEYEADLLDQVHVSEIMSTDVVTIAADDRLAAVQAWLSRGAGGAAHQGFPCVDRRGVVVGVLTRRDVLAATADPEAEVGALVRSLPRICYHDCTVRQAVNHMVNHDIGRLPIVRRERPTELLGIVTRSDILSVFRRRAADREPQQPNLRLPSRKPFHAKSGR